MRAASQRVVTQCPRPAAQRQSAQREALRTIGHMRTRDRAGAGEQQRFGADAGADRAAGTESCGGEGGARIVGT